MPRNRKTYMNLYMKEYLKNPDKKLLKKKYDENYKQNARNAALEAFGNKCNKCGFADKRALQIDHVSGNGNKERKETINVATFYRNVLKSFLDNENKYQLLCANCNWIKRYENNELNICL